MAALNFPATPAPGDKYPQPPQPGAPVYTFDGEKWTTIGGSVGGGALAPPSTLLPLMDITPAVTGTSVNYSREDHRHPVDTSRAAATAVVPATALEYVSNSKPDAMLTPGAIWGSVAQVTLVDAASVSPNLNLGSDFVWTVAAAGRTLANPTNGKVGQKGIIYIQLSGGTVTTWGSAYKFPQAIKPTLSGLNLISYVVGGDGAIMLCSALTGLG
jgi:hypothetical protein